MSDIFDVAPPAWLQRIAQPADTSTAAKDVGILTGGLLHSFETDTSAPKDAEGDQPDKGFKKGLTEARMDQINPFWKLQAAQTQAATLGRMAQAETAYAKAQSQVADTAAWMQEAPTLAPWLSATPEQRKDLPVPNVTSKVGVSAVQKAAIADQNYFIKQQAQQQQIEATKLRVDNNSTKLKDIQLWDNAYSSLTPQQRIQVDALPNGGRDKGGVLTPQARTMINDLHVSNGNPPVGTAPSVEAATVRAKTSTELETQKQQGREKLDAQRAKEKLEYEKQRQQDRLELNKDASKYKLDLEKFKSELKVGTGTGKGPIGKDEFINRHYNTVFNAIMKDTGDALSASKKTALLLDRAYDSFKPAQATPAAPAKAPAKATASAPAAAPAGPAPSNKAPTDNNDPLGILK